MKTLKTQSVKYPTLKVVSFTNYSGLSGNFSDLVIGSLILRIWTKII